jgi:hypothetical protein
MFAGKQSGVVMAVSAFLMVSVAGCPGSGTMTGTATTNISGLLNNFSAQQTKTWPLGVQTVIDKPTTFNLRIWASDSLYISQPPTDQDDMLAWVILSDPFGGYATQYIPFHFTYEGQGWYTSTISRSVPEWVGSSGQLQPADWSLRVDKKIIGAQLQIDCEVIYTPYSPL